MNCNEYRALWIKRLPIIIAIIIISFILGMFTCQYELFVIVTTIVLILVVSKLVFPNVLYYVCNAETEDVMNYKKYHALWIKCALVNIVIVIIGFILGAFTSQYELFLMITTIGVILEFSLPSLVVLLSSDDGIKGKISKFRGRKG